MGFLKDIRQDIGNKVEGWLFKEEIEKAQQSPQNISPQQVEGLIEMLKEAKQQSTDQLAYAKQEMELVMAEDHTVDPTQSDIDRYFQYHSNYIRNVEKTGLWMTNEKTQLQKEDYDTKGRVEGWKFLRESCGLPQGSLDAQPWKSTDSGSWNTK